MAAVAQTTLPDKYEPRCTVETSAIVDTLRLANELEQQCQDTYQALASDTAVLTHELQHKGPIRRTIERVSTVAPSYVKSHGQLNPRRAVLCLVVQVFGVWPEPLCVREGGDKLYSALQDRQQREAEVLERGHSCVDRMLKSVRRERRHVKEYVSSEVAALKLWRFMVQNPDWFRGFKVSRRAASQPCQDALSRLLR
jgi:hypothetical protein